MKKAYGKNALVGQSGGPTAAINASLAGVISGALVDVLWLAFLSGTGIYEIIPGFIVSMIVSVVVTLLDKAPAKEVTDIFDAATSPDEE